MDDRAIFKHVEQLVSEERRLRDSAATGDRERLTQVEQELDQCWDLLRQRRAKREFGDDPDQAAPRSKETVEKYVG